MTTLTRCNGSLLLAMILIISLVGCAAVAEDRYNAGPDQYAADFGADFQSDYQDNDREALFTQAQLDSILASIALYPDSVLSHVLIAATYPLEVIQAARWSLENPELDGELAVAAVEEFDWDPSVKALTAFPELLQRMDEDIEWTQQLGDAFLVQEELVIASIQNLRDRAYSQGHLRTNDHVRVVREEKVIYIEPARTRTVYIPYYDPHVVYGRWWWDAYPPFHWRHPSYYNRFSSGISFYWGSGFRIAPSFYFSGFHWPRKRVVVVNHHHHYNHHYYGRPTQRRNFSSGREIANYREARHWRHNPHHRRGVSYRHRVQENRFVENATRQTRRGNIRQRSVVNQQATQRPNQRVDQRRWASQRRDSLNLRQTQARSADTSARSAARSANSRVQSSRAQARRIPREATDSAAGQSRAVRQNRSEVRSQAGTEQALRNIQSRRSQTAERQATTRRDQSSTLRSNQRSDQRSNQRPNQRSSQSRSSDSIRQRLSSSRTRNEVTAMPRQSSPARATNRSQARPQVRSEIRSQSGSQSRSQPGSQPRVQSRAQPRIQSRTQSRAQSSFQSQPPRRAAQPQARPQQRPQQHSQARLPTRAQPQPRRQSAPARQLQQSSTSPSRESRSRVQSRSSRDNGQRRRD